MEWERLGRLLGGSYSPVTNRVRLELYPLSLTLYHRRTCTARTRYKTLHLSKYITRPSSLALGSRLQA